MRTLLSACALLYSNLQAKEKPLNQGVCKATHAEHGNRMAKERALAIKPGLLSINGLLANGNNSGCWDSPIFVVWREVINKTVSKQEAFFGIDFFGDDAQRISIDNGQGYASLQSSR